MCDSAKLVHSKSKKCRNRQNNGLAFQLLLSCDLWSSILEDSYNGQRHMHYFSLTPGRSGWLVDIHSQ